MKKNEAKFLVRIVCAGVEGETYTTGTFGAIVSELNVRGDISLDTISRFSAWAVLASKRSLGENIRNEAPFKASDSGYSYEIVRIG